MTLKPKLPGTGVEAPRRILHIIPTLEGGGAERQLSYLCHPMKKLGWDVHIAMLRAGINFDRVKKSGAEPHLIQSCGHYDPRIVWKLKNLIVSIKPTIVQTWLPLTDILGGIAARLCGVPWILCERSSATRYPGTFKNRLRVLTASGATAVIANSSSGLEYWQNRLPNRASRYVIRNGLPLREIEQSSSLNKRKLGLAAGDKIILFAGRLTPEKNIDNLIASLRGVVSQSDSTAFLCGDGPLQKRTNQLIRRYEIQDRVRLVGYVDNLWEWMKIADVFVSVSYTEGMPNTVAEAMACGCPLVVSDIPQHRQMLNDDSAIFVDPNSQLAIREAITGVLNDPIGATKRVILGKKRAANWSVSRMADQYASVYNKIVNAR